MHRQHLYHALARLLLLLIVSACSLNESTEDPTPAVVTADDVRMAVDEAVESTPTQSPWLVPQQAVERSLTIDESVAISSPNGQVEVTFLIADGQAYYQISRAGEKIILPSKLGLVFANGQALNRDLAIASSEESRFDETWSQVWGEVREVRNHYHELRVDLEQTAPPGLKLRVTFRVYDDGVGFRYELPEQTNLNAFELTDEETEFVMAGNHQAWWIPAFQWNRYEYLYRQSSLSFLQTGSMGAVHTPLTLATDDGLYLAIHEANLTGYASMTLEGSGPNAMHVKLVPWSDGVAVRGQTPHTSPWRTIQIGEEPGDLLTNHLILNLNDPNVLEDTSWIRPAKYIGIWWGMHIDLYTWRKGPRHGATTERAKEYIDFAAKYGIDGVLVEGWNRGWDGDWTSQGYLFDFTTPYPDFDLEAVAAYAVEKGVQLIGHHETAAAIHNYEDQLEEAFQLYHDLGINTVKTGYVNWGQGINRFDDDGNVQKEWHHGQFMVEHHRKVIETAARYQIMLNVHEPVHATGLRRTWPNMMTSEGARGQEYNAWSEDGGNPPEHTTILPFTRLLAGPMDFTPGIFDILLEDAGTPRPARVNTTLAKQLALYVVIYSPLQMAADLPENYEERLDAFQFIRDVPVNWQETAVLHGAIGDFVTIVRQDWDSDDWYLGSITDEEGRTLQAPLSFLDPGRRYVAEIYADSADAHWQTNPLALDISQVQVDSETVITLQLAPGGGQAIRFRPATEAELESVSLYHPPGNGSD